MRRVKVTVEVEKPSPPPVKAVVVEMDVETAREVRQFLGINIPEFTGVDTSNVFHEIGEALRKAGVEPLPMARYSLMA